MTEKTDTENRKQARIALLKRRRRQLWIKFIAMCLSVLLVLVLLIVLIHTIASRGREEPTETAVPSTAATEASTETVNVNALRPEDRHPQQSVSILAVGDNLMHNTVMWAGDWGNGYYDYRPLYEKMRSRIEAADIACINQETIFINDPGEFTNYPAFGGPVQIGEALIDVGFDVVTHATNHCYDKFDRGLEDTLAFWHQHPEITVLGIHDSQQDADTVRVVEKNGIRIAMLNYTYGTNVGGVTHEYSIDYLWDKDKIAADIEKAKAQSDIVIVFPHWGSENTFEPDDNQRDWAQFFADHGVGAVIGCHTHTLQPMEELTGRDGNRMPVYWCLGNFISHMASYFNMLGGMAELTVSRDEYGVYVSDCKLSPLMTFAAHDTGRWEFETMPLEEYNDYLASRHLIENTSVKAMWDLYESIIPEKQRIPRPDGQ